MSERITTQPELQPEFVETEQKFLPLNPGKLVDKFLDSAIDIEQPYLSHPAERFNLRMRRKIGKKGTSYVATLKDKGVQTDQGLQRLEVDGTISEARYDYYKRDGLPTVHKFRASPYPDVVVDFFSDQHIHAESENPESWRRFLHEHRLENDFVEVRGDIVDNEWRAHYDYLLRNEGQGVPAPEADLSPEEIVDRILTRYSGDRMTVNVGGRSGSGKTTLMNATRERLHERGLTTSAISTDDYNIGRTALQALGGGTWLNYDANEVFDLKMAEVHARALRSGFAVHKQLFDYDSEEVATKGSVKPADINFIEGVKAHHPNFREIADLTVMVPSSLARSLGQRILRDLVTRPRFANPSSNIEYYLEYAEPEYRALL